MYLIKLVNLDTGAFNITHRTGEALTALKIIDELRKSREKGDPWVAGIVVEH